MGPAGQPALGERPAQEMLRKRVVTALSGSRAPMAGEAGEARAQRAETATLG
jgi:hypothetical protein